jgi:pimeloyl-ACP methyl ester carboxylesterase
MNEPMTTSLDLLRALVDRFDRSAFDAPLGRARIRLVVPGETLADVLVARDTVTLTETPLRGAPAADATLTASHGTWAEISADLRSGLEAHHDGRLVIRDNLHLGVGFLAATAAAPGPHGLRFRRVQARSGAWSILTAGAGAPVIFIHGLGATKGSFLPTVAALASSFRTIAVDLPGFGDSYKPLGERYHPPFFARAVVELMDTLGIERAHLIGNSMGGRIALELGLRHRRRVDRLVLLAPSLAWRRPRPWAPLVRALDPHLGLVHVAPRWMIEGIVHRTIPGARDGWVRAGVDEFLRAYMTPRGRVAFYAAARQIYLEEPHGAKGFWTRLAHLEPPALFVWGRSDTLVPIAFAGHVRRALPSARHLELACGHVPQIERPREVNAAILEFLGAATAAGDAPHPARDAVA